MQRFGAAANLNILALCVPFSGFTPLNGSFAGANRAASSSTWDR
jgi:hypothetical protein